MRSVSHKVIYIVIQFSGNSPAIIFLPIGASEIFRTS